MKKVFIILSFFLFVLYSPAQIVGDCSSPYNSADNLVQLIIGEGVQYSNPTLNGFACSSGFFDGTASNIGLDAGLVMATNSVSSISGGFSIGNGVGTDADLSELLTLTGASTTSLRNVIVLEFDFVPTSDVLTFDYVYASNEYPTSTCTSNGDVFGLFISGPGISGPYSGSAENIALVPDPDNPDTYIDTPVLVNTVNSGVATSGNSTPCDVIDSNWQDYSQFYVDNTDEETVAYPGFTVPLTAMAEVIPCQTYHMKIAIADVANGQLSSALFIKEGSFSTPTTSTDIEVQSNVVDYFSIDSEYYGNIYEGCGDATITFNRPNIVTGDINILYHLAGDAELGVDYVMTSNFSSNGGIILPAGDSQVELVISSFDDLQDEGVETIYLEIDALDYGCFQTAPDTIIFSIVEQPPLNLTLTDDFSTYCPGDDAVLHAQLSGGVGGLMTAPYPEDPYYYEWSQIGTAAIQTENPLETTEYCVEARDICGSQILEECVEVTVTQYPELEADSEIKYICEDVQEELCVLDVEGGEGNYFYEWNNANESTDSCLFDFHDEYEVIVTDGCNQQVTAYGEIYLDEAPDPFFESLLIPHQNLGLEFNNYTPEKPGLSYDWSFGDGIHTHIENPIHVFDQPGVYDVSLEVTTEIAGCVKEFSNYVTVEPLYNFYAPSAFSPNNDDINDFFRPIVTGTIMYELFVYDRFGKLVFNSSDLFAEWDGTYNGKSAAEGVYVYKAVMTKELDIVIFEEHGSVTLLR